MRKTKIFFMIVIIVATGIVIITRKTSRDGSMQKKYISAQLLLEDSFRLAQMVYQSGFRPTFLLALWRGGAQIGVTVTEFFAYKNAPIKNHSAVRVSAYNHSQLKPTTRVFDLKYVVDTLTSSDKLLIVDDVVDTGTSVKTLLNHLKALCGENMPREVKVASVYYKPKTASFTPNFYRHETDRWLVFPHELEGLTIEEIAQAKGTNISQILRKK